MAFNDFKNVGSYIRSTNIWDPGEIENVKNISPELRDLLVKLYTNLTELTNVLSTKESAYYPLQEFVTSSLFFNPNNPDINNQRSEFRMVYNTGAIGAAPAPIPHGLTITSTWQLIHIFGGATDNVGNNYYPFNYSSTLNVRMTATNLVITNGTGVNFTSGIIVVRYLKN